MSKRHSGPWSSTFISSGTNNPLFENIGAIVLMRTHLCLQIFRFETLVLAKDLERFDGFRCTVPGLTSQAKAVRQCIQKKLDPSLWGRYNDLMGVADTAVRRVDFFSDNLWASRPEQNDAFIMVKVHAIMDWHIRKIGLNPITPPLPIEEQLRNGISGLEYNAQEFSELRTSLRFITDEIALLASEYEKAQRFVHGLHSMANGQG